MTQEQTGLIVAGLVVVVLGAILARDLFKHRPAPEEIERRRRLQLHREGKVGDCEIIDVDPQVPVITYSYSVAGVGYTAAQEVAALREKLPEDLMSMIGPASIKFNPHNPANSIVVCEEWNGLRPNSRMLSRLPRI